MPIPVKKTLFVGVGGFGKATLHMLRRKFYETFGFHNIPAIEYLVFDTEKEPNTLMYRSTVDSLDRQVGFSSIGSGGRGDYVNLSCPRQALTNLYQGYTTEEVKDAISWFDSSLKDLGAQVLEDGASGIRSFGKLSFLLALMEGKQVITQAIQSKLIQLNNLQKSDAEWEQTNNVFELDTRDTRIDVFFICSTAGGTGSGTFLDLAYFFRYLFQNKKIDSSGSAEKGDMVLYLFLPDIILEDPRAQKSFEPPNVFQRKKINAQTLTKAGSYAALSELERYQLSLGKNFRFDAGWQGTEFFVPDWDPFKDPINKIANDEFTGQRPFDWVYLIGKRSTKGHAIVGAEDAIQMASDKLFLLLVEREQGKLLSAYQANRPMFVLPEMLKVTQKSQPREYARHYGGFGLSKISVGEPRIRRWAAFHLAETYVRTILNTESVADSQLADITEDVRKSFELTPRHFFDLFSVEMLKAVRSLYTGLRKDEQFINLVQKGVNYKDNTACYGNVKHIDAAYHQWKENFQSDDIVNEFKDMFESLLIEKGLVTSKKMIESLIKEIKTEVEEIKENLSDAMVTPDQFTTNCQEWLVGQQNNLDWIGSANRLNSTARVNVLFESTELVLEHIKELKKLPEYAVNRVQTALRTRFKDHFLSETCCSEWINGYINKLDPTIISDHLHDIKRGIVGMIKEVLKRVLYAQKDVIEFLENLQHLIGGNVSQTAEGTLDNALKAMLLREEKGNNVGLQAELNDLLRSPSDDSRNVFCGETYQKEEKLLNPEPDIVEMTRIIKMGFGEKQPDGTIVPTSRLWDIAQSARLDDSIKQWIGILVDSNVTDLKVKPSLKDYYTSLGTKQTEKLRSDIDKCFKTSASYLSYSSKYFGESQPTRKTQMVIAPMDFVDIAKDIIESIDETVEISGYQGGEMVILTLEDGVPLPFISIMDDLYRSFHSFEWPSAVWTRTGEPRELITKEKFLDVEIEVFLGIMIGSIWFDPKARRYKMILERQGMQGATQAVPIGRSISDVRHFFYGQGEKRFIDPYPRLKNLNYDRMGKISCLRKLSPLLLYYENYYFKLDEKLDKEKRAGGNPHLRIIKSIKEKRRKRLMEFIPNQKELKRFNNEALELCSWMHAFCRIIPILEGADLNAPDRDWIPVLMPEWNQTESYQSLRWHNQVFAPIEADEKEDLQYNPYPFAMDANSNSTSTESLAEWDQDDAANIPDSIKSLLWEKKGKKAPQKKKSQTSKAVKKSSQDIDGQPKKTLPKKSRPIIKTVNEPSQDLVDQEFDDDDLQEPYDNYEKDSYDDENLEENDDLYDEEINDDPDENENMEYDDQEMYNEDTDDEDINDEDINDEDIDQEDIDQEYIDDENL